MKHFDIIIIGGGPIGIACGLEAKKNGLSYLIIEKGCLVNSLYHYPVNMQFFSSSELLELDKIPFISKENKPRRSEALEYYRRVVTTNELTINLFETVLEATKNEEGSFDIKTSKDNYTAKDIIVATGFYDIPNPLNIPGEHLPKVSHYYTDPHYYAGMDVVVVGASNSSVDAALECYRKGANVTMVVRDKEISSHVKYWVKPDIENRIKEGSITALFNSNIKEITDNTVIINTNNEELAIKNDFVLVLTGYRPNFAFLKQLGVTISNDANQTPTYNTETMETNVTNLYLAGVVCGGLNTHTWFIENSRIHAVTILTHIISKYRYRRF
ncbi:YpdA family putative bacillithiol disulfide reductase [Myroides odoratimimus]|uniref:YpdA family putative bacillithiol disulfide reductase n=1 Tax=Myroides odoratimimus TaxID=76832 RepID=UPI002096F541|nr:YpdA family putative bacillithiol disulfide reductase [Myroides odoratimimus]MCO7723088.1 YpdA family putative bacillithiol disulfide reductase [Myroides odoratimimus]MDM1034835.1 YpdA family putative bacillithiol disulfide reductase [Myroides odoratimimus]MDM1038170.1 YpdA family putative bacillithiol disulfide reductase [Myroides odoratimimus]MDM1052374.1 YpdA family putative bacillithiol disulfide reductase [Myroides odoratimimus]MDM1461529.1 YpdA family putative bacillithiol disulfide r